MDLKDLIGKVLTKGQADEVSNADGLNMDVMNLIKKGLSSTDYDIDIANANKIEDVKVVKEGRTVGNLADVLKDILVDGKIEIDEVVSAVKTIVSDNEK